MPPRKRARVSQATSPTPTSQPKSPTPAVSSPAKTDEQILVDPWTDDEQIGLFKGLIRWKPTGIHKHFRLLALHQYLLDEGYIHPRNEHTKPAGIWRKLETLYNLESLDEREDARQLENVEIPDEFRGEKDGSDEDSSSPSDDDADVYSEAANKIENEEFDLPGEEFAEMKWAHRLAGEKERMDESPPILPKINLAEEPPVRFTPSFSIEPEPSEAATPASRKGRSRAGTSGTKAKGAAGAVAIATRRSARKAESVADEGEEKEEGGEEEEGAEDESEHEEERASQESTPAPRSTRSSRRPRDRPTTGSRTKGRGRTR